MAANTFETSVVSLAKATVLALTAASAALAQSPRAFGMHKLACVKAWPPIHDRNGLYQPAVWLTHWGFPRARESGRNVSRRAVGLSPDGEDLIHRSRQSRR